VKIWQQLKCSGGGVGLSHMQHWQIAVQVLNSAHFDAARKAALIVSNGHCQQQQQKQQQLGYVITAKKGREGGK